MSTVQPKIRTTQPAPPPGPEVRLLLDRLPRLCGGEEPIAGPLEGRSLSRLAVELDAAPAAVLWGSAGEGPAGLARADAALRDAGIGTCWQGLIRGEASTIADLPLVVAAGTCADVLRDALAAGPASLALDPVAATADAGRPARVAIVSYEVVGPTRNGGIGTATTSLAHALAAAGHEVVLRFTGWPPLHDAELARWRHFYAAADVDFDVLSDDARGIDSPSFNHRRAYEIYRWLSAEHARAPWDVVHVPDCQGHGYYALLAKHLGLDFEGATMVLGIHGSTRWVLDANRVGFENLYQLADDHMERECVALADVVMSPSAYMLGWLERTGWTLPERRFVQQYVLPRNLRRVAESPVPAPPPMPAALEGPGVDAARDLGVELDLGAAAAPRPAAQGGLREIVFFGRLEPRKGIEAFCDALDILADDDPVPELEVSFLGGASVLQGIGSAEYVRRRAEDWPWKVRVRTDRNQLEAVEYLRAPGRLAVMASPVDNSPNTVYEAIALGIGFVAARTGGIPELVHPGDVERATYDAGDPEALARALRAALRHDAAERARFAVDPDANVKTIVDWHSRVAGSPTERAVAIRPLGAAPSLNGEPLVTAVLAAEDFDLVRPTLGALERQDVERLETVLAIACEDDDPVGGALVDGLEARLAAREWRVLRTRRRAGAAASRRDAAAAARGRWLWLTLPGAIAAPELLSTLVASAERLDAELALVTTRYETPGPEDEVWRGHAPIGAALPALAYSTTGPGGVLVRRETLVALGGLEGRTVDAQHRNLALRAVLDGRRVAVVPPPLLTLMGGPPGDPFPDDAALAVVGPLAERLPPELADLAVVVRHLTRGQPATNGAVPDDVVSYIDYLERQLGAVTRSHSWRMTRPLRAATERARRRLDGP